MTPERWQRVKQLFQSVVECEASQRAAFLDQACAGDPDLRRELEILLASDERAENFLEAPAGRLRTDQPAESLVGRRIGPYQILSEIGRGGMGAVYLAERADNQFQKQVAIKVVKRGMDSDAILRRFGNEQKILAQLDHPNIARLIDGGTTEDGLSYFIMDYVEGLPIDGYCDTHHLPTLDRLKLFRTVCSAVEHAHQHHVVHRDLKPSNILVTGDGVPRLLDFGIAKVLSPDEVSQTTGLTGALRLMTPRYASPEQVRGEPVTPASDVYSLGVVLYELLSGHLPYRLRNHTPQEIERVIREEAPEKPSAAIRRIEEVPGTDGMIRMTITPESVSETREGEPEKLRRRLIGDLDNIVLMALRKEPKRRYGSAAQLSEDISRHLEGRPVLARNDTLVYRSVKFIKRNKAAVIALLVALIVIALINAGLYLLPWRDKAIDEAIDSVAVLPGTFKPADSPAPIKSIAVLPFKPLNAASRDESLELGMADTLITQLSNIRQLIVRPTSAVRKYAGLHQDPLAAGREQRVDAVLESSIQWSGQKVRVTARLLKVQDGLALWTFTCDEVCTDIFELQDVISEKVAGALAFKLTGEERKLLTKRYTENTDAYQAYLKGRYYWNKRTEEGFKRAIQYFQQAIDIDPHYALAYSGLADSYMLLIEHSGVQKNPRAKIAATKALEIDEALAEAHTSMAFIRCWYDWDWPEAEKEYKRAIELNPHYATARHWYSRYLIVMGRMDEAGAEIRRGQELDPLSLIINCGVGEYFHFDKQYDRAIEQLLKTIDMDPGFVRGLLDLGQAYVQKGMHDQAIAVYQKAVTLSGGNAEALSWLGYAYAVSGKRDQAQKVLDDLSKLSTQRRVAPYWKAMLYAGLGKESQALAWLEKAYQERFTRLPWAKVQPEFDTLRSDPRFADLLHRMGIAQLN